MKIEWNFPNNGCGQVRGIADAGIETFTGTEIQSLAREICQNSLDAVIEKNPESVVVEFNRYTISSDSIPGYREYLKSLLKAYKYWQTRKSEKTITYLEKAIKALEAPTTYVLKISDYNTTGLQKPYSDCDDGWNALTKIDGGATKSGDKAGAFGIGKNAPFCNSNYRLVFYRTLNNDDEIAAQGISRFISFPQDLNNSLNTMTTGFGYYGNVCGNLPVEQIEELDNLSIRDKVGTDIFIYGFNGASKWEEEVTLEILENFMMAIFKGKLTVIISGKKINASSLNSYMQFYQKKMKQAYCYYQVLLNKDKTKIFTKEFHNLGTLKLSILVEGDIALNRKILVTRTSGMKLFALGNFSRFISFSGILEMQGKELNEYFREMETPAHDKWLPNRYTKNPTQAKEYYGELKQWIRDIILSLGEYSSDEEIEVEGLSGILQDETSLSCKQGDNKRESLHDTVGNIIIQPRGDSKNKPKGLFYGKEGDDSPRVDGTLGNISPNGEVPTTRHLSGTRHRTKKKMHKGGADPKGRDTVHETSGGHIYQPLSNIRIIKISKDIYRASFILPRDISSGHIEIVAVGENGKSNKLSIKDPVGILNCTGVKKSKLGIQFANILGNQRTLIEFTLVDTRDYAMGVNVYEHN